MDNRTADSLIVRTGKGDMRAFEELYGGLSRAVFAYAMTIVKNPASAEDIMQDTFVRVYNAASGFTASDTGVSWIMRIAHNLAISSVTERISEQVERADDERDATDTECNAVERLAIAQALETLSDEERQVVTLHAVSGLRLHEIAQITGVPLGTIKWRNSEAMKKLRKFLGGEMEVKNQ